MEGGEGGSASGGMGTLCWRATLRIASWEGTRWWRGGVRFMRRSAAVGKDMREGGHESLEADSLNQSVPGFKEGMV